MGDPKSQRKQYATPLRPWDKERIESESNLITNYGLRSKKELWKTETILRNFRREARKLMAAVGEQADKESRQLLEKLRNLGLLEEDSTIVDVLRLGVEDVLSRRLQSIVNEKNLAKSVKEARQMIVHGHVVIGDKNITEPGYLVSESEEKKIGFKSNSSYRERKGNSEKSSNKEEATGGS